MKRVRKFAGVMLALIAIPAYADSTRQRGYPQNSVSPAEVVDSAGVEVGLWFPDILGDDEYLVRTINGLTFIAEVRTTGIKGNPAASLYYTSSDCSGPPFIQEVPGPSFYQERLTIPFQETFSGFNEETGAGIPPLYYADSTSDYTFISVCSSKDVGQVCNPIPGGCESINDTQR
jgi:hypothetical protein